MCHHGQPPVGLPVGGVARDGIPRITKGRCGFELPSRLQPGAVLQLTGI